MNITTDMYRKACLSALLILKRVFPVEYYRHNIVYNYRAIEIVPNNIYEETRIYCRIVYTPNGFALDISNISLDNKIRYQGKFTQIVKGMKRVKNIKEIWVSNVLTEGMHKACIKNGMEYDQSIMGYKLNLRKQNI